MVNCCLKDIEKNILKNLIGKKLIKIRHDPLDKFEQETVYGRIELFFEDLIVLVNYDYSPYPLFNGDDEHPMFSIKIIKEEEATSAFKDVSQINVKYGKVVSGITLVEDYIEVEWDGKKDSARILKAIIIKSEQDEIAFQGDYMIPLLDIIKGKNVADKLVSAGNEFENDSDVEFNAIRYFIKL